MYTTFVIILQSVKEKEKQWRIKGLTMAQWVSLKWNNKFVVAHRYSSLWEESRPILPTLVGPTAGRQAGKQTKCVLVDFKILNSLQIKRHTFNLIILTRFVKQSNWNCCQMNYLLWILPQLVVLSAIWKTTHVCSNIAQ